MQVEEFITKDEIKRELKGFIWVVLHFSWEFISTRIKKGEGSSNIPMEERYFLREWNRKTDYLPSWSYCSRLSWSWWLSRRASCTLAAWSSCSLGYISSGLWPFVTRNCDERESHGETHRYDKFLYIVKTFCSLSQLSKQCDSRREFLFKAFPLPFPAQRQRKL